MTKDQVERIIEAIRIKKKIPHPTPRAGGPGGALTPPGEPAPSPRPYVPIVVLLANGQVFEGMGWVNTHGDVEMSVERIALAHLTKGPVSVWINIDAVQAITD